MAQIVLSQLTDADPTEAALALKAASIPVKWVGVDEGSGGLRAGVADGYEATAQNFLQSYVFTKVRGQWRSPLPANIGTHLQHLRDYLAADPSAITNAQTIHVVQDLIRAVHFLNGRLANE